MARRWGAHSCRGPRLRRGGASAFVSNGAEALNATTSVLGATWSSWLAPPLRMAGGSKLRLPRAIVH
eukprot:10148880-Lingulodinium_polyedra.AAC.1